ncbi:MAG: MerR family transcriptional regulator [Methylococcales bacterium]|nr:MerR family transcriptional regulator [Methylococcales bacterium]
MISLLHRSHAGKSPKPATIKTVAQTVGIGIETIRYYQRIGLIEKPEKPLSGYRVYSEDAIARLLFIQRAKELGFSLADCANLLALGDGCCRETKELAAHKLEIINSKLHDLQAIACTLEKLIQSCEANLAHQGCPIITAISKR